MKTSTYAPFAKQLYVMVKTSRCPYVTLYMGRLLLLSGKSRSIQRQWETRNERWTFGKIHRQYINSQTMPGTFHLALEEKHICARSPSTKGYGTAKRNAPADERSITASKPTEPCWPMNGASSSEALAGSPGVSRLMDLPNFTMNISLKIIK